MSRVAGWAAAAVAGPAFACAILARVDDYGAPPTIADAAPDVIPCPAGLERCSADPTHACDVDLSTDPKHCGSCDNACANGAYCAAGACIAGCPGAVVYVSLRGADTNDGCTPATAMRSIAAALAFVKRVGAKAHSLHVCAGTYAEAPLVLDYPASMAGGYSCDTWARAIGYGYPSFDAANQTTILNASGSSATLTITGAAIDRGVTVDGFSVQAPNASGAAVVAVDVRSNAAPILSNDRFFGAVKASASGGASTALRIAGHAAPEVTHDDIHGGAADAPSAPFGSIGVEIATDAATPHVHANAIEGGNGNAKSVGSCGVALHGGALLASSTAALEDNSILGGTGSATYGSIALWGDGQASADVQHNVLSAGSGMGLLSGAYWIASGALRLDGNRMYGGDIGVGTAETNALTVASGSSVIIVNNLIHGGNAILAGSPVQSVAARFDGQGSSPIQFLHNTVYGGNSTGPWLIGFVEPVRGVVIENNLLGGSARANEFGIVYAGCEPAATPFVTALQHNVFFELSAGLVYRQTKPNCTAAIYAKGSDLDAGYTTAVSSNNLVRASACGDSECAPAPMCTPTTAGAMACWQDLLVAWSSASTGLAELVAPAVGWQLKPATSCLIAGGGLNLVAQVPYDFLSAQRTAPVSIGAHEQDAICR